MKNDTCCSTDKEQKPGLIKRIITNFDQKLKAKADKEIDGGCCGGNSDSKSGKSKCC